MTRKLNLCVIFGGRSGEHEISLMSARSILSVLDTNKYEIIQIGIDQAGRWWSGENVIGAFENGDLDNLFPVFITPEPGDPILYKRTIENGGELITAQSKLDVAFPVLHGTFGEDGTIQGLFELADIAYVGAGVTGSSVGMDKGVFKDVMRANHIPVVNGLVFTRMEVEENIERILDLSENISPYPMFVKPGNLGSSVGVSKAKNRSDLLEGIMDAARYDRRILVEKGLDAREIEISVLGNEKPKASVPGEIVPSDEFYSYNAKYVSGDSLLHIPAPISDEMAKDINDIAIQAYKAIDCAGMARVDFLLDKHTDELFLNEVNTIPGFTSISMYPKLWDTSGLSYPALIDELIDLAIERKNNRGKSKRTFGE